jgi:hypothetical protein
MGITWWCIFDWYSHQYPQGFQSMGLNRMFRDTAKFVRDTLKRYYEPYYNIGGFVADVESEGLDSILEDFQLYQNYPNPFNPITRIKYEASQRENVVIKIFDLLGQEIATLVNEEKPAGRYELELNANEFNLTIGIYFYQMKAGNFVSTKKLVLLK